MKKLKLNIEYELRSRSISIIWGLVSTAEGLSKWLADEVRQDGRTLTFQWGDLRGDHEIRTATITRKVKNRVLQFHWDDEDVADDFVEIAIIHLDLTDSYLLSITDFADAADIESLHDLWDDNMERLHRNSGI